MAHYAVEYGITRHPLAFLFCSFSLFFSDIKCGSTVAATNTELLLEEQKKELEADLEQAIQKGRRCGISDEDIKSLFELILEG